MKRNVRTPRARRIGTRPLGLFSLVFCADELCASAASAGVRGPVALTSVSS